MAKTTEDQGYLDFKKRFGLQPIGGEAESSLDSVSQDQGYLDFKKRFGLRPLSEPEPQEPVSQDADLDGPDRGYLAEFGNQLHGALVRTGFTIGESIPLYAKSLMYEPEELKDEYEEYQYWLGKIDNDFAKSKGAQSFTEAWDENNLGKWATGSIASFLPDMAGTVGLGSLGKAAAESAVKSHIKKKIAGAIGATVGMMAYNQPLAMKELIDSQVENEGAIIDPAQTFLYGTAVAGVETLADKVLFTKLGLGDKINPFKKQMGKALVNSMKEVAIEGAKGSVTEGATEALQEAITVFAETQIMPSKREQFLEEMGDRMTEAFAGGALMGGFTKGGIGGYRSYVDTKVENTFQSMTDEEIAEAFTTTEGFDKLKAELVKEFNKETVETAEALDDTDEKAVEVAQDRIEDIKAQRVVEQARASESGLEGELEPAMNLEEENQILEDTKRELEAKKEEVIFSDPELEAEIDRRTKAEIDKKQKPKKTKKGKKAKKVEPLTDDQKEEIYRKNKREVVREQTKKILDSRTPEARAEYIAEKLGNVGDIKATLVQALRANPNLRKLKYVIHANEDFEAYYDNGTIGIASNKVDPNRLAELIFHEATGHGFMRGILGEKSYDKMLDSLKTTMPEEFAEIKKRYEGQEGYNTDRDYSEELMANFLEDFGAGLFEKSPTHKRVFNRIRLWAKAKFGINLTKADFQAQMEEAVNKFETQDVGMPTGSEDKRFAIGRDKPKGPVKNPYTPKFIQFETPKMNKKKGSELGGSTWKGNYARVLRQKAKAFDDAYSYLEEYLLDTNVSIEDQKRIMDAIRIGDKSDQAIAFLIKEGMFELDENGSHSGKAVTKSFQEVMDMFKNEMDMKVTMAHMIHERILAHPDKELISQEDMADLENFIRGTQPNAEAKQGLIDINNAVLDYAVSTGFLGAEIVEEWKRLPYIPFHRVFDDNMGFDGTVKIGKKDMQADIKKLVGSTRKISNPLVAYLKNWNTLIRGAIKNKTTADAMAAMTDASDSKRVVEEVSKKGDKFYKDGVALSKEEAKLVAGRQVNGEAKYFFVHDEDLFNLLKGLDVPRIMRGAGYKFLQFFTNLKRMAITQWNPIFPTYAMAKDIPGAWAVTPGMNILAPIKAVSSIWKNDADYQEFQANFAGYTHRVDLRDDAKIEKQINEMMEQGTIVVNPNNPFKWIKKAQDFYKKYMEIGENATRLAIYKTKKKQGASTLQAAEAANDFIDFSRKSGYEGVRALNGLVAFQASRFHGLFKYGRTMAGKDRGTFMAKTGMLMLATYLLYLNNRDEEKFKEKSATEKMMYWYFYIGDQEFAIPKPHEIGALTGVLEAELQAMDGDASQKEVLDAMSTMTTDIMKFNILPDPVKLASELYYDENSFTGRPIEGKYLKQRDPKYRADAYSSAMGRLASKTNLIGPKQFEHLVRGTFGAVGQEAIHLGDMMAWVSESMLGKSFGIEPSLKAKTPFFGYAKDRFHSGPDRVKTYSRYSIQMKDLMDDYNTIEANLKALQSDNNTEEIKKVQKANQVILRQKDFIKNYKKTLRDMYKKHRLISANKNLSAEQKKTLLEANQKKINYQQRLAYERMLKLKALDL